MGSVALFLFPFIAAFLNLYFRSNHSNCKVCKTSGDGYDGTSMSHTYHTYPTYGRTWIHPSVYPSSHPSIEQFVHARTHTYPPTNPPTDLQYDTIQYSIIQHNTTQHHTMQHNTTRHTTPHYTTPHFGSLTVVVCRWMAVDTHWGIWSRINFIWTDSAVNPCHNLSTWSTILVIWNCHMVHETRSSQANHEPTS